MKMQHDTIKYYIEDALIEINKVLDACKKKTLQEEEMLPLMEHALHMLNASFNFRYTTRKEVSNLSQVEWEKNTMPPSEIFDKKKAVKKTVK